MSQVTYARYITQLITLASLYNILVGLAESKYNIEEEEKRVELKNSNDIRTLMVHKASDISSGMESSKNFKCNFSGQQR